jgi:uncharacterized protein (TIGR02271 family)
MALHKIKDFDPDYHNHFDDRDVKGMDLYASNEKIGSIDDILVDDDGQFRYLVINTGLWILGKRVLLPIGRARIDNNQKRVYADNLTKSQVEALPEWDEDMTIDFDREEQVRGVYRAASAIPAHGVGYAGLESMPASNSQPILDLDAPYVEGTVQHERPAARTEPATTPAPVYDRDTYTYDREPDLYAINEQNHPSFKLYQERLVASKNRQKTGEVAVGKRIETQTAQASVAVDKERVVLERVPGNSSNAVAPGEANFQAGEVSRMEVYEEVPEFHKEAFVREEVRVNKVVDTETATGEEQIRREEIDVNIDGRPIVEQNKAN